MYHSFTHIEGAGQGIAQCGDGVNEFIVVHHAFMYGGKGTKPHPRKRTFHLQLCLKPSRKHYQCRIGHILAEQLRRALQIVQLHPENDKAGSKACRADNPLRDPSFQNKA